MLFHKLDVEYIRLVFRVKIVRRRRVRVNKIIKREREREGDNDIW
jgi:hypothetical protein